MTDPTPLHPTGTAESRRELILPLLQLCAEFEAQDDIWWRCDGEYAPITFYAMCNDFFYWGVSDAEEITTHTLPVLREAFEACEAVEPTIGCCFGMMLYCAKIRKLRPQGSVYRNTIPESLWPLFDECGPPREIGFGNPESQP